MSNDYFLSNALRQSRKEAKKSQEFMSLEMEIARKTVQNWEKGVSEPTIEQALRWFEILNVSPLPYLFQYVHRDMENISSGDDIVDLSDALHLLLDNLPEEGIRQLLYLFYGDHGSSPRAIMNLVTAYLHTDMKDRVSVATMIIKNYEIAEKRGQLVGDDHIKPNVNIIHKALELGEKAAVEGNGAYVIS